MPTTPFALPRALVVPMLIAVACSGGDGGGNGGPTTPDPPVVTGISPAQAEVGASVTIQGSNFGTTTTGVSVTIRGEAAEVASVAGTEITATVPVIAPGPAPVSVTVGGTAAGTADFTVARTDLRIDSVEPNPVRAGGEITIHGAGFLDPVTGLVPADASLVIEHIDTQAIETLPISSRNFSEIVATLPAGVQPGPHRVDLTVAGQTSTIDGLSVNLQALNGSFAGFGTIESNSLNGLPVGLETTYDFTFQETAYQGGVIDVITRLNGFWELEGTVDPDGTFELGGPILQDRTWLFTGTIRPNEQGTLEVQGGVLEAFRGNDRLRFEYDFARAWHDQPVRTGSMVLDYGDIVNGAGQLPEAMYLYDGYDPLTWDPVVDLAGELNGDWFQSENPEPHIGTFDGTLLSFYGGLQIDVGTGAVNVVPVRAFWTPLNSSQSVDMVGFDAGGQEIARETFDPVDNIGSINPFRYSLTSPFSTAVIADFEIQPEGDGFTAGIQAGIDWIDADVATTLGPIRAELGYDFSE